MGGGRCGGWGVSEHLGVFADLLGDQDVKPGDYGGVSNVGSIGWIFSILSGTGAYYMGRHDVHVGKSDAAKSGRCAVPNGKIGDRGGYFRVDISERCFRDHFV